MQTSPAPNVESPSPQNTQSDPAPLISEALKSTPPERSAKGRELAQSPEALQQLDIWIENSPIDNPKNLILKDFLLAMPISISGPRLAELARKSADPSSQNAWLPWLKKYPDVYASVLLSWLKQSSKNPSHFQNLLADYAALRPESALDIWGQLIAGYPIKELDTLASFGLDKPGCAAALSILASKQSDEIPMLRLYRALSQCNDAASIPNDTRSAVISQLTSLLKHTSPSRRILAIQVIGAAHLTELQNHVIDTFTDAKNSTERASALTALHALKWLNLPKFLEDALTNGDETLRFTSASILAESNPCPLSHEIIFNAFEKEIWTDTQLHLYRAMINTMTGDKSAAQREILLDPHHSESLRLAAMHDLTENNPNAVTIDDMSILLKSEAPLELIASVSEHLYAHQPNARPKLRTWIQAQQPFNRRLLTTFARFVNIDANEKDASAIELMRSICSQAIEQENILRPCLHYMTDNAQTDEDRALAEKLQQRQIQNEVMLNLDYGF